MKHNLKIILLMVVIIFFNFFSLVDAATIYLTPVNSEIKVGEKINVEVRVDSEGVSLNAAQTTIIFPKNILEVVSLNKTESVFNLWLEEPKFSNIDGVISFTGGTSYGISGSAVLILKIEFRAKMLGNGTLAFTKTAITASDGSGTNILSKINDAIIAVVLQKKIIPNLPEAGEKLPEPKIIIRTPVPTGKLPIKPLITIPLYPEEDRWYNLVSQFTANWSLPLDVSAINTAINKEPNYVVPQKMEGLFENKTYPALIDGIYYIHVRFKNNIGWSTTAHYKIAVDTKPPLPFEINILEGEKTDNPTPTLLFETRDALSGLKEYQIYIPNSDMVIIPADKFTGNFTLPLQFPGKNKILVKAIDWAENSVEDSLDLEILPIASPSIVFIPTEIYSDDEQSLSVRGTSLPNTNVLIKIQKGSPQGGEIITEDIIRSDEKGNWEFTLSNQQLKNGKYILSARSQDERGALSLWVTSSPIKIKSKPIIEIGVLQLGMGGTALLLFLILMGSFGSGIWFYRKKHKKLIMRVEFAESEITKIFKLIKENVGEVHKSIETKTIIDDNHAFKILEENLEKMESYLKKGVDKIKK